MKSSFLFVLILLLIVSLFGCINGGTEAKLEKEGKPQEIPQQTDESDKEAVTSLVEDFGSKLQTVPLLAPKDIVKKSIQENYGDFVSPALLAEWLSDPLNAPGRLTSSPWPDRVEILNIEKLSESTYEVKGEIIEMTSVEIASGGVAAKRPITLLVEKIENRWLITAVKLGTYEESNAMVYRNTQYDFSFSLPESWQGYSIVTDKWEGSAIGDDVTVETGPLISIRHPQWTAQNQRQDIPIMIYTLTQWNALQQGEFHIGAVPVGPSELGRNNSYVFALPARYNYAFPTGYKEVENILQSNPIQANKNYWDNQLIGAEERRKMELYITVMKTAFREENGGNAFITVKLDTLEGLSDEAKAEVLKELTSLTPNIYNFEDVKNDNTKFELENDGRLKRAIDGTLLWIEVEEYSEGKATITGVSWFGNLGAVFPKYKAIFENGTWQLKLISMAVS